MLRALLATAGTSDTLPPAVFCEPRWKTNFSSHFCPVFGCSCEENSDINMETEMTCCIGLWNWFVGGMWKTSGCALENPRSAVSRVCWAMPVGVRQSMEIGTAVLWRFPRGIVTPAATVLEVIHVAFRYRIWLCSAPCPDKLNEVGFRSKGLIDLAVGIPRQRSIQADTCSLFVDFRWF